MTEMGQGQPQGTPPPPPPFGAPGQQKPKGAPKPGPNQGQPHPEMPEIQEFMSKIRNEYMARTMNTYDFIQQAYGELMANLIKPIMEKNQALEEELLKIKKQAPKPKKGTGRIVEKAKTNKPAPPK